MSVHKTKYGTFQTRWRDKYGRVHTETFTLQRDANKLDREIKDGREPHKEGQTPQKALTFAEFAELWIKDYCEVHQTYSTIKICRNRIRRYFMPIFGPVELKNIRPIHVVKLQKRCFRDLGLKQSTVNQIVAQFRKMMSDAYTWELIDHDPCRKIKPLSIQKRDYKFWTFVEKQRFLTYCKSRDPELYRAVAIAVNTGLRSGELQGLLRDSVDFERKEIIVKRIFCLIERKLVERTKNQKSRVIQLNKVAFEAMSDRRLIAPNEPILTDRVARMNDHRFPEMCKAAGVSVIRWHDLRHTFASHMAMAGVPLMVIQEILGHATLAMTQRYAHLCKGFSTGATSILDHEGPSADVPELFRVDDHKKVRGS